MGGGDKTKEGFDKLQIQQSIKKDPETEARQRHLFEEAERFAATKPFQRQYGAAPGMTQMSQAGQQFLTSAILGDPDAYQDQDLGFKPWERPGQATPQDSFQYTPMADVPPGGGDQTPPLPIEHLEPPVDPSQQDPDDFFKYPPIDQTSLPPSTSQPPVTQQPPVGLEDLEARGDFTQQPPTDPWSPITSGPSYADTDWDARLAESQRNFPPPFQPGGGEPSYGPPVPQPVPTGPPPGMAGTLPVSQPPGGLEAMGDLRGMQETARSYDSLLGRGQDQYDEAPLSQQAPPTAMPSPLETYQQQKLKQAIAAPDLPGGVGIGETQEAATAMRGLLARQAPEDIRAQTVGGPRVRRTDVQTQEDIAARDVAGPAGFDVDEFGGASTLGGRGVEDYLQPAGVEAQVAQAQQDYETALAQEQSRQASAGAFGSRGSVEEAGLRGAQQRNIAQIRGAGFERAAQMMEADTARQQQAGLQQQQLTQQQRAQTQQLGAQADLASAQNRLGAEQANLRAAMASGDRQAIVDAQRNIGQAEMGLQAAQGNQRARLQAEELSQRGRQQYGQQQMDVARGLAGAGAQLQRQTYGAGQQLTGMGEAQERQRLAQQAFDYEQWLRQQDPSGLQLVQSMMPGGQQQTWQRKPSKWGQVAGGLLSAGGLASRFINPFGGGGYGGGGGGVHGDTGAMI
jgi:hypothetical protein